MITHPSRKAQTTDDEMVVGSLIFGEWVVKREPIPISLALAHVAVGGRIAEVINGALGWAYESPEDFDTRDSSDFVVIRGHTFHFVVRKL
jgi:hypothetical protein